MLFRSRIHFPGGLDANEFSLFQSNPKSSFTALLNSANRIFPLKKDSDLSPHKSQNSPQINQSSSTNKSQDQAPYKVKDSPHPARVSLNFIAAKKDQNISADQAQITNASGDNPPKNESFSLAENPDLDNELKSDQYQSEIDKEEGLVVKICGLPLVRVNTPSHAIERLSGHHDYEIRKIFL